MNIRPLIPCYCAGSNRGIGYGSKEKEDKPKSELIDLSSPESCKDFKLEDLGLWNNEEEVEKAGTELAKGLPKGARKEFIKSLGKTIKSLSSPKSLKSLIKIRKNSASTEEAIYQLIDTLDNSEAEKKEAKEIFSKISNHLKKLKSGIDLAVILAMFSIIYSDLKTEYPDIYSTVSAYPPLHDIAGPVTSGVIAGIIIGSIVIVELVTGYPQRKKNKEEFEKILNDSKAFMKESKKGR